ncbi:MAG: endo-polygalacturonase, partial [Kiritimatiellae bacterium]|nr:endo-polygalacturonase [Kiritimatiellia bacterium]
MVAAQGMDIVVKVVTLMSSWTWMLVFNEAENVLVDNIKLLNGRTLNDDGIDICRSRHVTIRNS